MSLQKQAVIWLAILAGLVLFVAVFSEILLPFLAGIVLAYFLDPLADGLERSGMSRLWATIMVTALTTLLALLALLLIVPLVASQLRDLATNLPATLESVRIYLDVKTGTWFGDSLKSVEQAIRSEFGQLSVASAELLTGVAKGVLSGGIAIVNFFSLLLITPVITFFMLLDWDRMIARVDGWLPRDHASTIRQLAGQIDTVLAGFIRGQGTVALLLGTMYAIGLSLVGLKYGVLVGIIAGIISFIPFVGAISGFAIGTVLAFSQFGTDWIPIAQVAAVFIVGQVIEGNFLQPKIVGDRVGLHPVWIIFSLFAFAYLMGLVGALIAVPVAGAIGVIVRFALSEYQKSPLYKGHNAETGEAAYAPAPAGDGANSPVRPLPLPSSGIRDG